MTLCLCGILPHHWILFLIGPLSLSFWPLCKIRFCCGRRSQITILHIAQQSYNKMRTCKPESYSNECVKNSYICIKNLHLEISSTKRNPFCEARRASHCHSPQTTYSSKSTCCVLSAQKSAMHVVVYADRRTIQHSIVDIIDWSWSYWQMWYPSGHVECFWAALSLHTNFRLLHIPLFCHNIHGGK